MPDTFNFNASPFDCLTSDERRRVRENVDLMPLQAGQVLLAPGDAPSHLFVLVAGQVQQ